MTKSVFFSEIPSSFCASTSSEINKSHHNYVHDEKWGKLTTFDELETRENGISNYSYHLEHDTGLGELKTMPCVIKFDHLANNKVIIIIDHEI